VAIAARICPNDVRLTLEQAIAGGMSLEDYSLLREVIAAIREGLPDADQMQPGQVFQHVLGALRNCPNNDPKTNSYICSDESVGRSMLKRSLGVINVCRACRHRPRPRPTRLRKSSSSVPDPPCRVSGTWAAFLIRTILCIQPFPCLILGSLVAAAGFVSGVAHPLSLVPR
jgi:hypothetical protein